MILPNTDVSIMDVRNVIGCPSTDLGTLCAKAKTGGNGGFAYQIVENGFQKNDGKLITDALPYHNIFSPKGPSEWVLPENSQDFAYNRIKRDSNKNYMYSLGSFGGYNSNARGVGHISLQVQAMQGEGTANHKEIRFFPTISLGDYDWRIYNANGNIRANKCCAVIEGGTYGGVIYESPIINLTGQTGSITFDQMTFEIDTSTVTTYSYPTRIRLYVDGSAYGYLPGEGAINVTISPEPLVGEIYVDIGGQRNIYVLSGKIAQSAGGSIYGTFYYNAAMDYNPVTERQLAKIEYNVISRSTGAVVRSTTISSGFNNNELPKYLYRQQTQFNADATRLVVNSTEYMRAIMYYN